MKKLVLLVVIIAITPFILSGYYTYSKNNLLREDFKQNTPLPDWWEDVDIGEVNIANYDELLTYWQSEKRCCSKEEIEYTNRQFFKAMYITILDHIDNPDIVVNAIDMMTLSYLDYDNFYPLQIFALNNYSDYKKPLHACANCKTGDVLASLLEDIQSSMAKKNLDKEYIAMAKFFIKKRGAEMSDYYAARVHLSIARAYKNLWQDSAAIDTLTYIIDNYKDSRQSGSMKSTLRRAKDMLNTIRQKR